MIGIIYALFSGVTGITGSIKGIIDNIHAKERTYDSVTNTHVDKNGLHRDSNDNELLFWERDKNGHCLYTNKDKTKRIDYTQLHLDADYNRLRSSSHPGVTVMLYSTMEETHSDLETMRHGVAGSRYKDLSTGKILVIRSFGKNRFEESQFFRKVYGKDYDNPENRKKRRWLSDNWFYMDVDTGFLVRVIDGRTATKEDMEWMDSFNQRQKEQMIQNIHTSDPWKYYCNSSKVD